MTIPSRPQHGWSESCPHCGVKVPIEPWAMFGDTTCVECHRSLWFLRLEPKVRIYDRASAEKIRDQVLSFVAARLGVDPQELAKQSFAFEDLGTDSLDTIELITRLEQKINSS
jgi:acyl carrier protein